MNHCCPVLNLVDNRFGGICDLRPCALIGSFGNRVRQLGNFFKRFTIADRKSYTGASLELLTNNDGLKLEAQKGKGVIGRLKS